MTTRVSWALAALWLSLAAGCGNGEPSDPAAGEGAIGADAADGAITATLNGEAHSWYVTSSTRGGQHISQSDWSGAVPARVNVSLFGHTRPDTTMGSNQALMLSFTVLDAEGALNVVEPEITYLSGGMTQAHQSGEEVSVELADLSFEGETMSIAGTFAGVLDAGGAVEGGAEPIRVENGEFEATVSKLQ
jgi:hypothetical protein